MLWLAVALTIGAILLLSLTHTFLLFALALALLGVPHGITYPISAMLIAESVVREDLGFANSLFVSVIGTAGILIPIVVGLLMPALDFRTVFLLVAGIVCLLAIVQYLLLSSKLVT